MTKRTTNRRKRVVRTTGWRRFFRPRSNRRIKAAAAATAKPTTTTVSAAKTPPKGERRPIDWRAIGRRATALSLFGAKVAALGLALAGTVFGGYYGYQRLAASTYFDVKTIEVRGARRLSAAAVRRMLEHTRGITIFSIDTHRVERALAEHPWIHSARVRRQFPETLEVTIVEQRAQAALLLRHLYLVNTSGEIFKRAEADEAEALPVITGIRRARYLTKPHAVQRRIRRALAAIDEYYRQVRPPLSEVHLSDEGELTLLLRRGGVALRFGSRFGKERLRKLDAVLAALGPTTSRIRAIYLDNEVHPERVVVRTVND